MKVSDFERYPYCGIPTFLRAEYGKIEKISEYDFQIGVMGIPFDEGCPYKGGQRFCAKAVREQSLRIGPTGIYDKKKKKCYLGDVIQNNDIIDFGDVNIIPTDVEGSLKRTADMAAAIVKNGRFLLALGGDHTVTFPLVSAFDAEAIGVIYLDAHYDDLPISEDFQYTNGHPLSHILNMDHVKQVIHVGGRTMRDVPCNTAESKKCSLIGVNEYLEQRELVWNELVDDSLSYYVSIDIDALDCSLVPGCVSAEPDGFTFQQLNDLLESIAKRARVVGFDLVEIAPDLDVQTQMTSYLGMLLAINFLGKIFDK